MFGKSPVTSGLCILSHPPQALALFYQANWKSPKTSFQHTHTHIYICIYKLVGAEGPQGRYGYCNNSLYKHMLSQNTNMWVENKEDY